MFHFNQPNIERKKCVWTTKYKRLLEIGIVPHVEMKSAFTFQPKKRLVSTNVKSAKPAAMFWIFLSRTKNRQICCLVVMENIVLQGRRIVTTKKKNHLHFWRFFSANHNQAQPKQNHKSVKWLQIWNKRIRFLLVDDLSSKFNFQNILFSFNLLSTNQVYSTYSQLTGNHDLLSLQRRNPVDSWFWSRLCYYCNKWSRPKSNNQLTRNTLSCLVMAVVSKARFIG